jgi:hypothetical protein
MVENSTVQAELRPTKEKSLKEIAFEHLFTGNTWSGLPAVDLAGLPTMLARAAEEDLVAGWLRQACAAGEGFAHRFELLHPSKVTMTYEMADITPIEGVANRKELAGLIKEGERLGGRGLSPVSWLDKTNAPKSYVYQHGTVEIIGVLDEKDKPKAIIWFRKGQRPRKGRKIKEQRPVYFGNLQPAPVGI